MVHFSCLRRHSSTVYWGLHTTPDSFRLSQCPLAASTPAPGPPHQFLQRHLLREQSALSGLPRGFFGNRLGGNFGTVSSRCRGFLYRHFQPRGILCTGMGLFAFVTSPRQDGVFGYARYPWLRNRPIRAPWPPSTSTRILHQLVDRVAAAPLRIRFGRRFQAALATSPRRPPPSCDWRTTDTSQATMLTIAHADVTTATCWGLHATPENLRRSQNLPVAIHLHRVPIAANHFPGDWRRSLRVASVTFSALR